MFSWFKKKETSQETADRLYVETMDLFSELQIVRTLALMHRSGMQGGLAMEEWGDLAVGAWRTLELGAQLLGYRVERATLDEGLASASREAVYKGMLLSIARMIEDADPRPRREILPDVSVERAQAMSERNALRDAATLMDRLARERQYEKAFNLWRACAKGAYLELPVICSS